MKMDAPRVGRRLSTVLSVTGLALLALACGDSDPTPPAQTPPVTKAPDPAPTIPDTTTPTPEPTVVPTCETAGTCIQLRAEDPEDKVQAAFATVKPGQSILLAAGRYRLTSTLSLAAARVTVKGAGKDQTILDFSGQIAGSEGIFAESVESLVLEDFAVVDTKGNGIKTLAIDRLVMRRLAVSWTGADASAHGPYGLYPVSSKNVLIEGCVVSGASDSGIYLGQSDGAEIRNNEVFGNVAGIEIENTFNVVVHDNKAHDNTGGILVFDLPGLPQKGGHAVIVRNNEIADNNTNNFAPAGNTVAMVPRGTGFLVMANAKVEAFGNTLRNNKTVNAAITSYFVTGLEIQDPAYMPLPREVHLHDNVFVGGGTDPDPTNRLGQLLLASTPAYADGVVPSILWDGIPVPESTDPNPNGICLQANGGATFANLHFAELDPTKPEELAGLVTLDAAAHDCTLPPVAAPVVIAP